MSVQMFVVQASRSQNEQFSTPSTADTMQRAEKLLEMYRARQAPTGVSMIANFSSPQMDLR